MRPVVILGALGDLVRLKLLEEMPDRFDVPSKNFQYCIATLIVTYYLIYLLNVWRYMITCLIIFEQTWRSLAN